MSAHAQGDGTAVARTGIGAVGVCGAGVMGSGIAETFALGGCSVMLYDVDRDGLAVGRAGLEKRIRRAVDRGHVAPDAGESALDAVTTAGGLDELGGADLVVEAVVEHMGVKQQLFRELERVCRPDALLVTNTSTLSPTEIAAGLDNPARAAGLHFFNPAARMKLVEIIAGQRTSDTTIKALREVSTAIGKTTVLVNESPGGIVGRLQLVVRNEAVRLLAEGVASAEDIDTAMRLGSGWPMGPLELTDLVGLDVHMTNSDTLSAEMGSDRYRPHPLVRKLVRAGQLGRKTGQGFHAHDGGGRAK